MNTDIAIQSFLTYLKVEKRRSKHTVRNFQSELKSLNAYLAEIGVTDITKVTKRQLRLYCARVISRGGEASTLKTKLSRLNVFFAYLRLRHNYGHSPTHGIQYPKIKKKIAMLVMPNFIEDLSSFTPRSYLEHRDNLITQLLLQTGIRRSELVGMTNISVHLVEQYIQVLGKGNKERIIPIGDSLTVLLRGYINLKKQTFKGEYSDSLFLTDKGQSLSIESVYKIVNTQMCETDIPKKSPHALRHIFATTLHQNGVDIQEIRKLLGHASVATTQLYINDAENLKKIYAQYFPDLKKYFKKKV